MAGQNPGSPTDFQYFYEDEVYKINNRGQVVYGLVLENYEANSSDQESDVETPVQKGEIRVVWHPSGTERVISEKSVSITRGPLSFANADKADPHVTTSSCMPMYLLRIYYSTLLNLALELE